MTLDILTKIEEDWFLLSQQLKTIKQQNPQVSEAIDFVVMTMTKQLAHEKMECLVGEGIQKEDTENGCETPI